MAKGFGSALALGGKLPDQGITDDRSAIQNYHQNRKNEDDRVERQQKADDAELKSYQGQISVDPKLYHHARWDKVKTAYNDALNKIDQLDKSKSWKAEAKRIAVEYKMVVGEEQIISSQIKEFEKTDDSNLSASGVELKKKLQAGDKNYETHNDPAGLVGIGEKGTIIYETNPNTAVSKEAQARRTVAIGKTLETQKKQTGIAGTNSVEIEELDFIPETIADATEQSKRLHKEYPNLTPEELVVLSKEGIAASMYNDDKIRRANRWEESADMAAKGFSPSKPDEWEAELQKRFTTKVYAELSPKKTSTNISRGAKDKDGSGGEGSNVSGNWGSSIIPVEQSSGESLLGDEAFSKSYKAYEESAKNYNKELRDAGKEGVPIKTEQEYAENAGIKAKSGYGLVIQRSQKSTEAAPSKPFAWQTDEKGVSENGNFMRFELKPNSEPKIIISKKDDKGKVTEVEVPLTPSNAAQFRIETLENGVYRADKLIAEFDKETGSDLGKYFKKEGVKKVEPKKADARNTMDAKGSAQKAESPKGNKQGSTMDADAVNDKSAKDDKEFNSFIRP